MLCTSSTCSDYLPLTFDRLNSRSKHHSANNATEIEGNSLHTVLRITPHSPESDISETVCVCSCELPCRLLTLHLFQNISIPLPDINSVNHELGPSKDVLDSRVWKSFGSMLLPCIMQRLNSWLMLAPSSRMKVTSNLRMLRISGRTVVLFRASYDSRLGALLTIVHVTQSPLRTNVYRTFECNCKHTSPWQYFRKNHYRQWALMNMERKLKGWMRMTGATRHAFMADAAGTVPYSRMEINFIFSLLVNHHDYS